MKIFPMLAAVLASTILGGQTARAGIIFDTITGSTALGVQPILGMGLLGDSFSTGASESLLSDVKVNFYNPSPSPLGSVVVTLYSSDGNAPGSLLDVLGSVATPAITPGTFRVEDFSGFVPYTLAANTRYWILLSTNNGSPLDAVVTNNFLGAGVVLGYIPNSGSALSTATVEGTFELQVSTIPTAVPEPSSLVLCGIAGLGGLGYLAPRRRRASTAH